MVMSKGCHEFTPYQTGQRLEREKEAFAGWDPGLAIVGDATTGDQTVKMRMIEEIPGPGMENHQDAYHAADVSGILGEFKDRRLGGGHEEGITNLLIRTKEFAQLFGNGHGYVKVCGGQHLIATRFQPGLGLTGMALGTVPVFAGVKGVDLCLAMIATVEVPAQGLGAASANVGNGMSMRGQYRGPMLGKIVIGKPVENVGEFKGNHDVFPHHKPDIRLSRSPLT
jgi:hypothetical protein